MPAVRASRIRAFEALPGTTALPSNGNQSNRPFRMRLLGLGQGFTPPLLVRRRRMEPSTHCLLCIVFVVIIRSNMSQPYGDTPEAQPKALACDPMSTCALRRCAYPWPHRNDATLETSIRHRGALRTMSAPTNARPPERRAADAIQN